MSEEEKQTLEARFAAIEARIVELEQHAHSGHTLGIETLQQIVTHVKQDIVQTLTSILPQHEPASQQEPVSPEPVPVPTPPSEGA